MDTFAHPSRTTCVTKFLRRRLSREYCIRISTEKSPISNAPVSLIFYFGIDWNSLFSNYKASMNATCLRRHIVRVLRQLSPKKLLFCAKWNKLRNMASTNDKRNDQVNAARPKSLIVCLLLANKGYITVFSFTYLNPDSILMFGDRISV
jgi:hypothetical protein